MQVMRIWRKRIAGDSVGQIPWAMTLLLLRYTAWISWPVMKFPIRVVTDWKPQEPIFLQTLRKRMHLPWSINMTVLREWENFLQVFPHRAVSFRSLAAWIITLWNAICWRLHSVRMVHLNLLPVTVGDISRQLLWAGGCLKKHSWMMWTGWITLNSVSPTVR